MLMKIKNSNKLYDYLHLIEPRKKKQKKSERSGSSKNGQTILKFQDQLCNSVFSRIR